MDVPFSWSASRHDTFSSCRRKYYYSYYASHEDDEIKRLKKLSALPLWAGSVVHDAIEWWLKKNDTLPPKEEQDAFIRRIVHTGMVGDWRESEMASRRFRLFEHEYDVPVEQEDKRIAVNIVMRSLQHFFASDTLKEALDVGREQWLALEDLVSFHVGDVEVYLRMDLAFRDRQRPGGDRRLEDRPARGPLQRDPGGGLRPLRHRAGLGLRPRRRSPPSSTTSSSRGPRGAASPAEKIEHARSFIAKSAGTMKSLLVDPLENLARLEDFPMVDRPRVCRRCNFRKLCFPRPADEAGAPVAAAASAGPGPVQRGLEDGAPDEPS